jgi:2-polyprenyl-3-methyl-5-hydroxy-6-metoxy-1,4-benzoquinol methylase
MTHCTRIHRALNVTINQLLKQHAKPGGRLLDVGCWDGEMTLSYGRTTGATHLIGIEGIKEGADQARRKGIEVLEANLESDTWELPAESVDTVVCNQVFEHLKNIFTPFDQIAKALKPGGVFVISVPNLASFHNRVMLFLGMQPSSIRVWGPHIRGYACHEFTNFCRTLGLFELITIRGVGFFPLVPELGGNAIASLWTSASHTPVWVLRRTSVPCQSFHERYVSSGQLTVI